MSEYPDSSGPTEEPKAQKPVVPTRRDRLRPAELITFAAVLAVFAGLVVLLVLRNEYGLPDFAKAGIVAGIVFIVVMIVLALLGLGGKPSQEDIEARKDLNTDDKPNWH